MPGRDAYLDGLLVKSQRFRTQFSKRREKMIAQSKNLGAWCYMLAGATPLVGRRPAE